MEFEISTLTIKILLILFPGIIAVKINDRLEERKEEESWQYFIRIFVYGLIVHVLAYIHFSLFFFFVRIPILKEIINYDYYKNLLNINENFQIEYINIISTSFFAILFGFLISKINNSGILNKFAQDLNITKKFPEQDVWSHVFNNIDSDTVWIVIRDFKNDLMYQGFPTNFSAFHDSKELLLKSVYVFSNSTGKLYYKSKLMYFNIKNNKNFIIEFQKGYKLSKKGEK